MNEVAGQRSCNSNFNNLYTLIQTLLSGGTHWYVRSLSNIACEGPWTLCSHFLGAQERRFRAFPLTLTTVITVLLSSAAVQFRKGRFINTLIDWLIERWERERERDFPDADSLRYYTVSTKKVTPCIHYHNSDKQCQIWTEFWINNAMSNCKQITKFK